MSPFSFSLVFYFRRCFCLTLFWLVVKKSKAFPLSSLFLLIMFGKCHVPFFLFSGLPTCSLFLGLGVFRQK